MRPLTALIVFCVLCTLAAVWIDPQHRWWRPISLHQGADFYFTGNAVIWATVAGAAIVLRRMIHSGQTADSFPFAMVLIVHVQLVLPWGIKGPLHNLLAFLTMGGYSSFLFIAGLRCLDMKLLVYAVTLLVLTAVAFISFVFFQSPYVFGIVEQFLVLILMLTLRAYDEHYVQIALDLQKQRSAKVHR